MFRPELSECTFPSDLIRVFIAEQGIRFFQRGCEMAYLYLCLTSIDVTKDLAVLQSWSMPAYIITLVELLDKADDVWRNCICCWPLTV